MANEKWPETGVEKATSYGELLMELSDYFQSNRKRFKTAINRVSDQLSVQEIEALRVLSRERDLDTPGEFEDRFEEICWAIDQAAKREVVRIMLRHL